MLRKTWFSVVLVVTCIIQTQCADKYTDKNRPYEFGFKIGEEQHRHEKKDENGIIMGEFGFLTADGVYHVTVYATDENGNFKILSMKNIRVKPYPTTAERQGHSIPFPPSQNLPQTQGPSTRKATNIAAPLPPSPAKSCSHCSLPTTTTVKPKLTDIAVVSRDQPDSQFNSVGGTNQQGNHAPNSPAFGANPQGNQPSNSPVFGSNPQENGPVNSPAFNPQDVNVHARSGFGRDNTPQGDQYDQNYPQGDKGSNQPKVDGIDYPLSLPSPRKTLQSPVSGVGAERSPKQLSEYPQEPTGGQRNNAGQLSPNGVQGARNDNKPVLLSARMQIVDKNTDINYKKPGEKDGLPKGLTKDNMQQLLYTFNYTVGFHGHFEEGYTSGAKQGYYFVTGRNGVRTRVDYVADENGFRPKISQEVLDLLSDDVPKPETEKEEKFGLKGYEFKWLYYPVPSKS